MSAHTAPSGLVAQYPITLPADYDMQIVRDRVRNRGATFDDRAGLLVKAYCVRQVGVDGSPVNQYAPFYLWNQVDAAAEFLWRGAGFEGIVRDFGRPEVRTWLPEARVLGLVPAVAVTHATVRVTAIGADADLVDTVARLRERVHRSAGNDDVHLAVGGVDPRTWQTVEFVSRAAPVGAVTEGCKGSEGSEVFRVLHVSQPEAWS